MSLTVWVRNLYESSVSTSYSRSAMIAKISSMVISASIGDESMEGSKEKLSEAGV